MEPSSLINSKENTPRKPHLGTLYTHCRKPNMKPEMQQKKKKEDTLQQMTDFSLRKQQKPENTGRTCWKCLSRSQSRFLYQAKTILQKYIFM